MTARYLTLAEAAGVLRKSPRWLRDWLRAHPRDDRGFAFCATAGKDRLFTEADIERIAAALREDVPACRSGSSRRGRARRRTGPATGDTSDDTLTAARRLASEKHGSIPAGA